MLSYTKGPEAPLIDKTIAEMFPADGGAISG